MKLNAILATLALATAPVAAQDASELCNIAAPQMRSLAEESRSALIATADFLPEGVELAAMEGTADANQVRQAVTEAMPQGFPPEAIDGLIAAVDLLPALQIATEKYQAAVLALDACAIAE